MINLSKVYKRKQKCFKIQKKRQGFCKTSFRSFSEVLPFFTYIYYLSTFISHLIIYICRLDILFKKHFYFLSVNSNFKPPSC